jgi:hypothetical protein
VIAEIDDLEPEGVDPLSIAEPTPYPRFMHRTASPLAALLVLAGACASAPPGAEVSAPATADIRQAKLDIAYSAIADEHYAKPSSKALLEAALDAFRREATAAGASVDVATPAFEDKPEPSIPDFKRFAEAARRIAAAAPQVPADRFADRAIAAMLSVAPDCHAYYDGIDGRSLSRPSASAERPPVTKPDQAGLEWRLLEGRVGYVTWHRFELDGAYDIRATVRAALDGLVAQGARAWFFDLRSNRGGKVGAAEIMYSWFLNGEPVMRREGRDGRPETASARKELRLPDAYQLPIVVALNPASESAPELLALALKEHGRATIVGGRSGGCLGAINSLTLSDGTFLAVPNVQFVGAVTGARYNNAGIPPDVAADDATAIAIGTRILHEYIAKGMGP